MGNVSVDINRFVFHVCLRYMHVRACLSSCVRATCSCVLLFLQINIFTL